MGAVEGVAERFDVRRVDLIEFVHVNQDVVELIGERVPFVSREAKPRQQRDARHFFTGEFHGVFLTHGRGNANAPARGGIIDIAGFYLQLTALLAKNAPT